MTFWETSCVNITFKLVYSMFYDRFKLLKTTNDICSWYIWLKYREEEFPIRGKEFRQALSKILLIFLYFQWPRTVKAYQTVNITLHSSTVCSITERKGNRYSSMTQKGYPHKIMSTDQQKIITKPRNCILTLPGQIFDMEAIFSDQ